MYHQDLYDWIFYLVSLLCFILKNYILTPHGWEVLHDLIFSKVQPYVDL